MVFVQMRNNLVKACTFQTCIFVRLNHSSFNKTFEEGFIILNRAQRTNTSI